MSVFDTWAANVAKARSEQAAVTAVIVGLASQNYKAKPAIGSGRQNGSTFRIYHWSDTPVGDLILLTGASIEHTLVRGSDLEHSPKQGMIYILADDVSDKVKEKVDKTLGGKRVKNLLAKAAGEGTPRTGPQRAPRLHTPADTSSTPKRRGRPPGTGKKQAEPEVKVVELKPHERPEWLKARQAGRERFAQRQSEGVHGPNLRAAISAQGRRQYSEKKAAGEYQKRLATAGIDPDAWRKPKELSEEEREAEQAKKLAARLRAAI